MLRCHARKLVPVRIPKCLSTWSPWDPNLLAVLFVWSVRFVAHERLELRCVCLLHVEKLRCRLWSVFERDSFWPLAIAITPNFGNLSASVAEHHVVGYHVVLHDQKVAFRADDRDTRVETGAGFFRAIVEDFLSMR